MEGQPKIWIQGRIAGGGGKKLADIFKTKVVINVPLRQAIERKFQLAIYLFDQAREAFPKRDLENLTLFLRTNGTHAKYAYLWIPKGEVSLFSLPLHPCALLAHESNGDFTPCLRLTAEFWGREYLRTIDQRLCQQVREWRRKENIAILKSQECRNRGTPLLKMQFAPEIEAQERQLTAEFYKAEEEISALRAKTEFVSGQCAILLKLLEILGDESPSEFAQELTSDP